MNAAASSPVPSGDVIQRAKSQLEQMIDLHPQAMALVDRAGVVLRANRAFLLLIGVPDYRAVLGRELDGLFTDCDPATFHALLADHGAAASREAVVRQLGSLDRRVRFTAVGTGGADALVIIADDITEETKQAERTERANKVEAVRALMGALMHHLNQPLTVLMIRARLMLQALESGSGKPEDVKATLQEILELTARMAALLRKAESSRDFVTQEYVRGLDIMKLDD